jgi:hypothetical protein
MSNFLTSVGALTALIGFLTASSAYGELRCSSLFNEPRYDGAFEIDISNKRTHISAAENLEQAYKIAEMFNVYMTDEFKKTSPADQLGYLNAVNEEMTKIPPIVLSIIAQAGFRLELVMDAVTHHPQLKHLSGVTPRGWPVGQTWDVVPGGGATPILKCTVIAANSLQKGHGSRNLILHEHAHTFDLALSYLVQSSGVLKLTNPQLFSKSDEEFMTLWQSVNWKSNYQKSYIEEAFAESFAFFFDSTQSRNELQNQYPTIYNYFVNRFGEPKP